MQDAQPLLIFPTTATVSKHWIVLEVPSDLLVLWTTHHRKRDRSARISGIGQGRVRTIFRCARFSYPGQSWFLSNSKKTIQGLVLRRNGLPG